VCVDAGCSGGGCGGGEAGAVGPCGTPCRQCPERDSCAMDCNVADGGGTNVDNEEEKKVETGGTSAGCNGSEKNAGDPMCCTSSRDKAKTFLSTLPPPGEGGPPADWRDRPDVMFPDELKGQSAAGATKPLVVMDTSAPRGGTWLMPTTLEELLRLLRTYSGDDAGGGGGCKIVVGNTEVGIGELYMGEKFLCTFFFSGLRCIQFVFSVISSHLLCKLHHNTRARIAFLPFQRPSSSRPSILGTSIPPIPSNPCTTCPSRPAPFGSAPAPPSAPSSTPARRSSRRTPPARRRWR
jgi:hypothetical protein